MWVTFSDLRLCYTQSHSDDSVVCMRSTFCTCTRSCLPHNVVHSSSRLVFIVSSTVYEWYYSQGRLRGWGWAIGYAIQLSKKEAHYFLWGPALPSKSCHLNLPILKASMLIIHSCHLNLPILKASMLIIHRHCMKAEKVSLHEGKKGLSIRKSL